MVWVKRKNSFLRRLLRFQKQPCANKPVCQSKKAWLIKQDDYRKVKVWHALLDWADGLFVNESQSGTCNTKSTQLTSGLALTLGSRWVQWVSTKMQTIHLVIESHYFKTHYLWNVLGLLKKLLTTSHRMPHSSLLCSPFHFWCWWVQWHIVIIDAIIGFPPWWMNKSKKI